ncbi:MAG: ABC transporter permease [Rhizobiales bacterium]|nr:ABC transporter permease [Hyphomicrobiales bacterium]
MTEMVQHSSTGSKRFRAILMQLRPIALPIATAAAVVYLWELLTKFFAIREVIVPAPTAIMETLGRGFALIARHAVPTAKEAFLAFAIACALGILSALLLSYSRLLRECVLPNLIALQFVPKVALAPLFIIWFGLGTEARLIFAVFIAFFPVMISTAAGLTSTPPEFVRLGRALTASKSQIFLVIRLPAAIPFIFSGMKIAATMTMIGVVVGEFITAKEGLGYLILFASSRAETSLIFACLIILCAIGLVMYGMVLALEKLTTNAFRTT